jgi:hypothetical protein
MTRLLALSILTGLLVWFGYRQFLARSNGVNFPAAGLPTVRQSDGIHTIEQCKMVLQSLAHRSLRPLDAGPGISTSQAVTELRNSGRALEAFQTQPEYHRLAQTCAILQQLLQERGVAEQRLKTAGAAPAARGSSGLVAAGGLSNQTGSPTLGSTGNFFQTAASRDWEERCRFYKAVLDRLLAPAD